VDSPRSSGFQVASRRRYSSLSYVQVLRITTGLEGSPRNHSLMGPNDGDGSEYILLSPISRDN
jgi:hypothetical protein